MGRYLLAGVKENNENMNKFQYQNTKVYAIKLTELVFTNIEK